MGYTYASEEFTVRIMEDNNRIKNVTMKVSLALEAELKGLSQVHHRSVSQICWLLVQRGLGLYRKDGLLLEDVEPDILVPVINATEEPKEDAEDERKGRRGPRKVRSG
jgi:hypothetical protein